MPEWIYFIHPPRDDFAATMTDQERAVWGVHFERFEQALADGTLILVGPTLGGINTGLAIFEAPDEAARAGSWRRTRSSPAATPAASCARSASPCSAAATPDQTGSSNSRSASRLPCGSLNQAARPGPILAMPPSVFGVS